VARHGSRRAGRWPVQLRFSTHLTSEEYVSRKAWRDATLAHCPVHPNGGCSLARHGTYERVEPPGTRVARWYCPQGHITFSLLPDCLAARFSGTLCDIEATVVRVEQASSLEAAADRLRLDIELPGAMRWTRRRVSAVYTSLTLILGLLPERFAGCQPSIGAFCQWLQLDWALPALREIATLHLGFLPPPLGFKPSSVRGGEHKKGNQHPAGPDPPAWLR
jgi:hypothetical protein